MPERIEIQNAYYEAKEALDTIEKLLLPAAPDSEATILKLLAKEMRSVIVSIYLGEDYLPNSEFAAKLMGSAGGSKKSRRKSETARENGKKGGRPRKQPLQ